ISNQNGLAINSNKDLFYTSYETYRSYYPYTEWTLLFTDPAYSVFINSDDIIYASLENGIIRSVDNGNNWESIFTENISRSYAHDLRVNGNILFIATNSYGLYELMTPTNVEEENNLVTDFHLSQNYPNPFNPVTNIKFSIPKSDIVEIKVYDILGKEIQTLLNEYKTTGSYEVEFDASNLPSGIYFYRMVSGNYPEAKKMVLLR
ncbi:MAG: T9SS type A sorting domain-containing protein, partial [Ignavibacteriaceae bacterium]|nr:T9SS type A sorting domain-containing protein [Ignavibacteriaceae bacterium]